MCHVWWGLYPRRCLVIDYSELIQKAMGCNQHIATAKALLLAEVPDTKVDMLPWRLFVNVYGQRQYEVCSQVSPASTNLRISLKRTKSQATLDGTYSLVDWRSTWDYGRG